MNDDVHANKIVCTETEKENVEINSKSLCGFSESRKKSEEKKELDSISLISPEKLKTSKSETSVDLTEDEKSTSQNKEVPLVIKEDDTSLRDFSLVISDSVLNSINNKSVEGESNQNNDDLTVERSNGENDCNPNSLSNIDLESDVKEETLDKTLALDESLNNSEDDDFAISSEESPVGFICLFFQQVFKFNFSQ